MEIAVRESASGNTERQAFHAAGYQLDNQQLTCYVLISVKLRYKIILKIQLIENKEVTLFVQLNW